MLIYKRQIILIIYHKISDSNSIYMLQELRKFCKDSLERKIKMDKSYKECVKLVFLPYQRVSTYLNRICKILKKDNITIVIWPMFIFSGTHVDEIRKLVYDIGSQFENIEFKFIDNFMKLITFRNWFCKELESIISGLQ